MRDAEYNETFILEPDDRIVSQWAKRCNAVISFREAGADTLRCLAKGAGAKPHRILDKTIKEKKGNGNPNPAIQRFFARFIGHVDRMRELLMGLVGKWDQGEIVGLYLTSIGEMEFRHREAGQLLSISPGVNKNAFLKLTDESDCHVFCTIAENILSQDGLGEYYFYRCFFTGDYDLHDLYFDGQLAKVPVDAGIPVELRDLQERLIRGRWEQLEKRYPGMLFEDLENPALLAGTYTWEIVDYVSSEHRAEGDGFVRADYQRVQHGSQANYVEQMFKENELEFDREESPDQALLRFNAIVAVVAIPSLPALFYIPEKESGECDGWILFKNLGQYKDNGLLDSNVWKIDMADELGSVQCAMMRTLVQMILFVMEKFPVSGPEEVKRVIKQFRQDFIHYVEVDPTASDEKKEEQYQSNQKIFDIFFEEAYQSITGDE